MSVPTRVKTWLKLVRNAWADTFWKKYSLLPNVHVSFPSSKPQSSDYKKDDQGGMNFIYYPEVHIIIGLRFPLHTLVHQFFHYTCLYPVHTHVNIIWVLLGVCVLNRQYGIGLELEVVLYAYTIKRHSSRKYYFVANTKLL